MFPESCRSVTTFRRVTTPLALLCVLLAGSPALACGAPAIDFQEDPLGSLLLMIILSPLIIRELIEGVTAAQWFGVPAILGTLLGAVALIGGRRREAPRS